MGSFSRALYDIYWHTTFLTSKCSFSFICLFINAEFILLIKNSCMISMLGNNFFIELVNVPLINKIIWVSGIQFYNTLSIYCTVCLPAQVMSPSISISFFTFFHPLPCGNHQPHCWLCPWVFFLFPLFNPSLF